MRSRKCAACQRPASGGHAAGADRGVPARHLSDDVEPGQDAVTCGGVIRHDDVARLLATERVTASGKPLEHVAVANTGGLDRYAVLFHGLVQAKVAHDGGDQCVVLELAPLFHGDGKDGHDLVAVDDIALGIHGEAAVGVAVVRDAHVCANLEHLGGEQVEVSRTNTVVDVQAVGVGSDECDLGTRVSEDLG